MSVADFEGSNAYNDPIDETVRKIIEEYCRNRGLNSTTAIKLYKYSKFNVGLEASPIWQELDVIDKMDEILNED